MTKLSEKGTINPNNEKIDGGKKMFKTINFIHDNKKNSVKFDVEKNGEINHIEVKV